ncbi:MAG: hypothetical protein FJ088_01355 [Deltaproteobacteria bacterium]|nr:hypothetical protein [Deltaproteobacteria bacterium]
MPVEVMDYFEYYKSLGGSEEGGCSVAKTGSATPFPVFLLLMILAVVLIRFTSAAFSKMVLLTIIAASLFSGPLYAESPQNMAIEIKFGPYLPDMDSEFSGLKVSGKNVAPFKEMFGNSPFLMSQIEFDYQFFHGFGSIGLGFGIGYSYLHGNGLMKNGEKSTDSTAINILPLNLSLVYRFDVLAKRFSFPFVIYGKGGFDYLIWWITDGVGNVSSYEDSSGKAFKGSGGTFGAHATAGVSLLLDLFAPSMAQTFDIELGVNNSYLFAEAIFMFVDDFGKDNSFNFSDNTFLFGMAFEF